MNAQFRSLQWTGDETAPRLSFELENARNDEWDRNLRLSYQVLDTSSEAVLVEGDRISLPENVFTGGSAHFDLPLSVPTDPGSYRVYACLMLEGEGWAYDRGFAFIFAEFVVTLHGFARLTALRVTDLQRLRRFDRLRKIPRALVFPFRTVWRNRHLSKTLVKREILARSRASFGGALWTILNPLLLILTYFFVFGLVLQTRIGNDPSPVSFALYLLAGMMPWLAISEAVGRAPLVLVEYRSLLRKVVFPIETLPVNLVFSGLVGEAFGLAVFTLGFLLVRGHLPWTIVLLPALLVPQILFTAGVCWFLSALGVFIRDLGNFIGFFLTIWFFTTPICYPENQIPAPLRPILTRNPVFILVRGYRAIFLEGRPPAWNSLAILTLASLALAIAGFAWFYKLRRRFIDLL